MFITPIGAVDVGTTQGIQDTTTRAIQELSSLGTGRHVPELLYAGRVPVLVAPPGDTAPAANTAAVATVTPVLRASMATAPAAAALATLVATVSTLWLTVATAGGASLPAALAMFVLALGIGHNPTVRPVQPTGILLEVAPLTVCRQLLVAAEDLALRRRSGTGRGMVPALATQGGLKVLQLLTVLHALQTTTQQARA